MCEGCKYAKGQWCQLTAAMCLPSKSAGGCAFYNADLSGKNICGNCEHFIGPNGDWGLCCRAAFLDLDLTLVRPLRTSWLIVGKALSFYTYRRASLLCIQGLRSTAAPD